MSNNEFPATSWSISADFLPGADTLTRLYRDFGDGNYAHHPTPAQGGDFATVLDGGAKVIAPFPEKLVALLDATTNRFLPGAVSSAAIYHDQLHARAKKGMSMAPTVHRFMEPTIFSLKTGDITIPGTVFVREFDGPARPHDVGTITRELYGVIGDLWRREGKQYLDSNAVPLLDIVAYGLDELPEPYATENARAMGRGKYVSRQFDGGTLGFKIVPARALEKILASALTVSK